MEGQAQTVFENKPFVCDTSEIRDTSGCLRGSRPLRGETQKKDTTYVVSFFLEGTAKIDILKSRKSIGGPPNRPSGRRRRGGSAAPSILIPKGGAALRRRNPQKRTSAKQMSFFVVRATGLEPVRPWDTSTSSLPVYQFQHARIFCTYFLRLSIIRRNGRFVKPKTRFPFPSEQP